MEFIFNKIAEDFYKRFSVDFANFFRISISDSTCNKKLLF